MVHVNVVDGTAFGFVMAILVVCPLQIEASAAKSVRDPVYSQCCRCTRESAAGTSNYYAYALPLNVFGTLVSVSVAVVAPL
jgi:hypothetical protein